MASLLSDSRSAQRIATSGNAEAVAHLDEGRVHHALAADLLARGDLAGARKAADHALHHLGLARRTVPDAPARLEAAKQRHAQLLASVERLVETLRTRADGAEASDLTAAIGLVDAARQHAKAGRYEEANQTLGAAERHVLAGMNRTLHAATLDYTVRASSPLEEFQHELARHQSLVELVPLAVRDLRPRADAMAAFATARGEPVVGTSDSRPGVRVWSYSRRHDEPKVHQSPGFVTDLHAWRAGQTDRVLARNTSGYLGLLDGKTGGLLGTPFAQSESDWADALAATCFKNRPVAAAVLGNKTLQAWYVDTGETFGPAIELEGDNRRRPIGLCAQGEHLFAATVRQYTPRSILLHDLVTGESVESPPGSGEWRTYQLVPGAKGPLVVTFGWRSQLRIWSCQTGATLDIDVRAYSATGCLLRGRRSIVCIDLDSYLHVFDADTGEWTMVPFEVTKREHLAAIDVDGELLVAMGDSIGLLEIWREKKLQMEIDVNGEITALAVLPPRTLIVGAAEGVLCMTSSCLPLSSWSPHKKEPSVSDRERHVDRASESGRMWLARRPEFLSGNARDRRKQEEVLKSSLSMTEAQTGRGRRSGISMQKIKG